MKCIINPFSLKRPLKSWSESITGTTPLQNVVMAGLDVSQVFICTELE